MYRRRMRRLAAYQTGALAVDASEFRDHVCERHRPDLNDARCKRRTVGESL